MAKDTLISQVIEQNEGNEYYKNFKFNYGDRILREHNQETYEKIVKGLVTSNKVLFEQATGTGKSYLALKFLHDHAQGKRVLFVSPSNAIKDSFTDLCNKWLGEDYCEFDTCLYQGLKGKQNKHYDIIIFDEVHRMGAKTWGPNAEALMNNNPNASILGMTATLDRPDCVDVRQYFDNREPVSRITLVEALEKGILPKPDYTLAKVDFEDDVEYIDTCIKDFKEKLKQAEGEEKKQILDFLERLKKAKQAIAESEDIPQIFANEITTKELKQGKFIVFCPAGEDEDENKESLHRMKTIMKQAPKWFEGVEGIKKIKKYSVYSKLDAKKNSKIIDAFERDDTKALKLLFSINMLNEGLHVDDIDGVIMLRRTGSRIIYLQQLGRALSVGHKHQPKIFDFVANLNYVDVTAMQQMVTDVNKVDNESGYGGGDVDTTETDLRFKLNVDNLDTLQLIDTLKSNIFTYNHQKYVIRQVVKDFVSEYVSFVDSKKREPKNSRTDDAERHLYSKWIKYGDSKNLNDAEIKYIKGNGIELRDERTVRTVVKKFVEDYNSFVRANGRKPKRRGNNKEDGLYQRFCIYTNPHNINEQELKYLEKNGIDIRYEEIDTDNIRTEIKKFVKDYLSFVSENKREPKSNKNSLENGLYQRYRKYTNPDNITEEELLYLKDNNIQIQVVEDIRKSVINFVAEYNEFVLKYKREPERVSSNSDVNEERLYSKWLTYANPENLSEDELKYICNNGITLRDNKIRAEVKSFVEEFLKFIEKENRLPQRRKSNYEDNLYHKWLRHTNPHSLYVEEIEYLKEHNIELRNENIRQEVKTFVSEYIAFFEKYKRKPKKVSPFSDQQEITIEKRLYKKWLKWTNSENVNEEETQYLKANNIDVRVVKKLKDSQPQVKDSGYDVQ